LGEIVSTFTGLASRHFTDAGYPLRHRAVLGAAMLTWVTKPVAGRILRWKGKAFDAQARATQLLMDPGTLVLMGKPGTGKTQMATELGLIYDLVRTHKEGAEYVNHRQRLQQGYWTLTDLLDSHKGWFATGGEPWDAPLQRARSVPWLVLDDLQAVRETDWDVMQMASLINARYAALLRTILITNETFEGFAERMGDYVMSRLEEDGSFIECNWRSARRKT
jgi:DNA replication protein DnaC